MRKMGSERCGEQGNWKIDPASRNGSALYSGEVSAAPDKVCTARCR